MRRTIAILVIALAAVGAGTGIYAAFSNGGSKTVVQQVTVPSTQPASDQSSISSVTDVYNSASKGVVEISVSSSSTGPFGESRKEQAQGSGFVYDTAGHVITNEHVVDGAESVSVRFWNGATYKATVVGTDPSTDLAVVKVDAPSSVLHPLTLGDSGKVQIGQNVVAIGSPFGLEGTITAGIVSALHRDITAPNNYTITDSIQTDAAINHGNSGGPLLDLTGKVIGVTAQIESDSGDNAGVGFAIPSNTVRSIASQLISGGNVKHAYLGVAIRDASGGVALTEIRSGTPAERAGLQTGDVITRIDGRAVTNASQLSSAIDAKQPGNKVTLTYKRNGQTKTVTVTLGERPS
jgi:putative serine protease PepD